MRKTDASLKGSNEVEVAGVYDKRMLNILYKAWMYDQGMAVRLKRPSQVQASHWYPVPLGPSWGVQDAGTSS